MAYALGAVKPWVKTAADEVGTRFSVSTIYGVGIRAGESDHPKGLALDFMVGTDAAKGDSIANFVQQNAGHYGVTYIIWKQHIWSTGRASEGWRQMSDRGSITANHFDHVHVSFAAKGASNASLIVPGPVGGLVGGLLPHVPNPVSDIDALKDALKWITDSHNWLRVGMFIGGMLLILMALGMFTVKATGVKPADAAKVIGKVAG